MLPRPSTLLAAAALVLGATACDGGADEPDALTGRVDRPAQRATPAAPSSGRVDADSERVIREWADTLRRGDVEAAAELFALPSRVSNGTAPIELETRDEVVFFNRTLPCGARVIGTESAAHGFVIATLRLTERPGPGECGTGTGATARTAFIVREGHITDWFRVPDGDLPDAEVVPA